MPDPDSKEILIKLEAEIDSLRNASNEISDISDSLGDINKSTDQWNTRLNKSEGGIKKIVGLIDKAEAGFGVISGQLAKIGSMVGASGFGLGASAEGLINYNKALIGLTAQFSKYGVGATKVEASIISLGNKLKLTRAETIELQKAMEKGLPIPSLQAGEKILENIRKVTGSNKDVMAEMAGYIVQLVAKYPSLQKSAERMNKEDKDRLKSLIKTDQLQGQMDRQTARALVTWISQHDQAINKDKEMVDGMMSSLEVQQEMNRTFEAISITIGRELLPWLKKISDYLSDNMDKVLNIAKFFGTWVAPLILAKSLLGSITSLVKLAGFGGGAAKLGAIGVAGIGGYYGGSALGGMAGGAMGGKNKELGGQIGGIAGAAGGGLMMGGIIGGLMAGLGALAKTVWDVISEIEGMLDKREKEMDKQTIGTTQSIKREFDKGRISEKYMNAKIKQLQLLDEDAKDIPGVIRATAEDAMTTVGNFLAPGLGTTLKQTGVLDEGRGARKAKRLAEIDKLDQIMIGEKPINEKMKEINFQKDLAAIKYITVAELDQTSAMAMLFDVSESVTKERESLLGLEEALESKLTTMGGSYEEIGMFVGNITKIQRTLNNEIELELEKRKHIKEFLYGKDGKGGEKARMREIDIEIKKAKAEKKILEDLAKEKEQKSKEVKDAGGTSREYDDAMKAEKAAKNLMENKDKELLGLLNEKRAQQIIINRKQAELNDSLKKEANARKQTIQQELILVNFAQKYAVLQENVKNSAIGLYDTMLKLAQLSGLNNRNMNGLNVSYEQASQEIERTKQKWIEVSQIISNISFSNARGDTGDLEKGMKAAGMKDEDIKKRVSMLQAITDKDAFDLEIKKLQLEVGNNILKQDLTVIEQRKKFVTTQDKEIERYQTQADLMKGNIDIANSMMMGIGASVKMNIAYVDELTKVYEIQTKKIQDAQSMLAAAKKSGFGELEAQIELNNALKARQGTLKEIFDTTKQIRDGWIGAIKAMTVGSGRITKITMDQTKNTGIMVENLDVVRSGVSGAMRRKGEKGQIGFRNAGRYDTSGRIVDASGRAADYGEAPWKTDFAAISPGLRRMMQNSTKGAGTGIGGQTRAVAAQASNELFKMSEENRKKLGPGSTAMGPTEGASVITGSTIGGGRSGKVTVPGTKALGGSGLNINVNINVDDAALKKAFTATVDIGAPKTSRPHGG